jgi:hypothetical protein
MPGPAAGTLRCAIADPLTNNAIPKPITRLSFFI